MEDQGGTIDAVSETSFLRAVIKHVTKMGGTSGTEDLSHWHHLRPVHLPGDVVLSLVVVVWLVCVIEAWPSGARVKLVFAGEQIHVAADAGVHPSLLVLVVLPGPGLLSGVSSGHLILD